MLNDYILTYTNNRGIDRTVTFGSIDRAVAAFDRLPPGSMATLTEKRQYGEAILAEKH